MGCGAGSASLYFTQMGSQVLAVDGCRALCEHTHRRTGCPVRCMRFEELDFADAFDGVWACASLLHIRMFPLYQSAICTLYSELSKSHKNEVTVALCAA